MGNITIEALRSKSEFEKINVLALFLARNPIFRDLAKQTLLALEKRDADDDVKIEEWLNFAVSWWFLQKPNWTTNTINVQNVKWKPYDALLNIFRIAADKLWIDTSSLSNKALFLKFLGLDVWHLILIQWKSWHWKWTITSSIWDNISGFLKNIGMEDWELDIYKEKAKEKFIVFSQGNFFRTLWYFIKARLDEIHWKWNWTDSDLVDFVSKDSFQVFISKKIEYIKTDNNWQIYIELWEENILPFSRIPSDELISSSFLPVISSKTQHYAISFVQKQAKKYIEQWKVVVIEWRRQTLNFLESWIPSDYLSRFEIWFSKPQQIWMLRCAQEIVKDVEKDLADILANWWELSMELLEQTVNKCLSKRVNK